MELRCSEIAARHRGGDELIQPILCVGVLDPCTLGLDVDRRRWVGSYSALNRANVPHYVDVG